MPSGPEIVIKTVLTLGKYLFNEIHHVWEYVSLRVHRAGRFMWLSDQCAEQVQGFGAGVRIGVKVRIKTKVKIRVGTRVRVRIRTRARR